MTAILELPLLKVTAVTGTNEDWIDIIAYYQAVPTSGDTLTPISLEDIGFHLQMRVVPEDSTTWVDISTDNGMLEIIGDDLNALAFKVPVSEMSKIPPGDYVADITASADDVTRRVAEVAVTIVAGITREGEIGT